MAECHSKLYDPDFLCQDDYEWLTETGPYANTRRAIIRRGMNKRRDAILTARKSASRSLLQAYQQCPHSVPVPALEAVKDHPVQPGKIVQELLSHNQISMTMDLYSHVLPGLQDDVIDRLEDGLERSEDDEDGDHGAGVPVG